MTKLACSGFSWDEIDFAFIVPDKIYFLALGKNHIDNTSVVQLLLSGAVQKQGYFSFSVSCTVLPVRGARGAQIIGKGKDKYS